METKITKKIIALLCAIIISATGFSQTKEQEKKSKYIFEGKVISYKHCQIKTGEYTFANYMSYLVQVHKIKKGDIIVGTVEILKHSDGVVEEKDGIRTVFNSGGRYVELPMDMATFYCNDIENKVETGVQNTNGKSVMFFNAVSLEKKSLNIPTLNKSVGISKEENERRKQQMQNMRVQAFAKKQQANKTASSGCIELFISEYLCGQGNNKAIEVYNPTSSAINLANYSLLIYHGASYIPTTIALTGTISAHSTHVVSKPNASSAILAHTNQTSNNLNFNGDECIVLNKASVHIDKIGEIGAAIGSGGWTLTPSGSTNNSDLRRQFNIGQGDTSWAICKSEWDVFVRDSVSNLGQHQNICSNPASPDPLYVTIQNGSDSSGYYIFDVMATSSPAHYFDNMVMHLYYNSTIFGTNIVSNGNITINNGASLTMPTYRDPNAGDFDVDVDTVSISVGTNTSAGTWQRILVGSTPTQLLHVKIKIANCGYPVNILPVRPDETYFLSQFTSLQNTNWIYAQQYDTTYYSGNLTTNIACPTSIQITDFTQPINAGVGEVLTITGSGFGYNQGNGYVKFFDADTVNFRVKLNAVDYISWSNTQIQINLPAFVDSVFADKTIQAAIGGGNFVVVNNAGQSGTSNLNGSGVPFSIYYNINQAWAFDNSKKLEVLLNNKNGNGGYTLRLNPTDFPAGSVRRAIFTKAMRDWTCMTGVNWIIGADTTINYDGNTPTGTNYISFSSGGILTGNEAARTGINVALCTNYLNLLKEADIVFNSTKTWIYDTTGTVSISTGQEDFYGVCLHELGHFIELRHHVDPTNLMYWLSGAGPLTPTQRPVLVGGTSPTEGGLYSVTQGASTSISCGAYSVMIPQNASCMNGIQKYQVGNYNLFPNPTASTITIQGTSALGTITVYNTLGQLITQQTTKENNAEIDLSNQANGMYLVKIQNQFIKIIKQ